MSSTPSIRSSRTATSLRLLMTLLIVSLLLPAVPVLAEPGPGPEVGPGDADYVFTFADDTVGEQPDYISLPWQQTDVSVVDSDWALDGRALQIAPYGTTNAFFAAVFDDVPAAANVEMLLRFRDTDASSDLHWMTGAGARIDGTAGSETAVLTQSRGGTNGLILARLNNGAFSGGFTEFPVAKDNYLRTRWEDGVVSAKMWAGTLVDEPEAWSVAGHTLNNPTLNAGAIGITRFFSQHTTEVDYLTIDILPDPDPDPGPGPEVGAGDADFVFTFADDTVGEQPGYISLPWQQTDVSVVESDWALDGKALQIAPYGTTNAFFAAVFDDVPDAANVEVLMRFQDTGTSSNVHWMTGAGARIDGALESETAVLTQSRGGTDGLILARINNGAFTGGFTGFPVAKDNYLRTRWEGGVVSAKMWAGTLADEPEAWSVAGHTLDNPTLTAGAVGITRFFSQHTTEVDYLTIDILPDPDPGLPAEVRLMPVGDSITSGWTSTPEPQPTYRMFLYDHLVASGLEPGSGIDFVGPYNTHPSPSFDYLRQGEWDHDSLSVSGWRTANARDEIASAVAAFEPDVLLVLIGVNDLRAEVSPEVAASNIESMIDNARSAKSDIKIVVAEIPPTTQQFDAAVVDYNERLRSLAAAESTGESPVVSVDIYTGYDIDLFHFDGLHPNPVGDEFIASRFADVLYSEFAIGDPWDDDPDPVAPTVTITGGPEGTVDTPDATFTFTADVEGASFECRLDAADWDTCTSPFEITGLEDGTYTFEVRASIDDLTGEPASRTWTVQLPDPDPDPDPLPQPKPPIPAGAVPLAGDWNGDGTSTPGWFVDGRWFLVPDLGTGEVVSFFYGRATDTPVVGDWNGSGTDTIGVRRNNRWFLRNSNTGGVSELDFFYGRATDTPVVGDWNGSGTDTIGVFRDGTWYLRNSNTGGSHDLTY